MLRKRRYQLTKLRTITDAAAPLSRAAAKAPPDACKLERTSLCVAAAPLHLKIRIGKGNAIPTVTILPRDCPWKKRDDKRARAVLEYAVGIGAEGDEGARMPELFEMLEYVGKRA